MIGLILFLSCSVREEVEEEEEEGLGGSGKGSTNFIVYKHDSVSFRKQTMGGDFPPVC